MDVSNIIALTRPATTGQTSHGSNMASFSDKSCSSPGNIRQHMLLGCADQAAEFVMQLGCCNDSSKRTCHLPIVADAITLRH